MINVERPEHAVPTWGPRPGVRQRSLSPARARLLERLREQPQALSLAALVKVTGLHENTIREHLDGLVRAGLVRRFRAKPNGRGRPAWLYESTAAEPVSEYAGLAGALAATISHNTADPAQVGQEAGEAWGRELARDRGATPSTAEQARGHVVSMLEDLGFDPEVEPQAPAEVHLTRCPLLEAAHRNSEVVCAVHLGIVRGALMEYGADPEGSSLEPFAQPGSCRLMMPPLADAPR